MARYRVVDLATVDTEGCEVAARSPEHAAKVVLGTALVRSGAKRYLRAKVYTHMPDQPVSMVRLYSRVGENLVTG